MKVRLISLFSLIVLVTSFNIGYTQQINPMQGLRDKIFQESKDIKDIMSKTNDLIMMTVLFDSCTITLSYIDAYFSMLNILDTIEDEYITTDTLDVINKWLISMEAANDMNLRSLDSSIPTFEQQTRQHIDRLRGYFTQLKTYINDEQRKLNILKRSVLKRKSG